MNRDEMVEFLENLGVKTELLNSGDNYFKRDIQFYINGIRYVINWFVNESTLRIGEGDRRACIPFRYMYYDTTYPLINGNKSIGFSYTKNEKSNMFDRMYPYEILRIPLEVENANAQST